MAALGEIFLPITTLYMISSPMYMISSHQFGSLGQLFSLLIVFTGLLIKISNLTNENRKPSLKEKRKPLLSMQKKKFNYLLDSITIFSSYLKIIRFVAWMIRFSKKSRIDTCNPNTLHSQELENALHIIIYNIQYISNIYWTI